MITFVKKYFDLGEIAILEKPKEKRFYFSYQILDQICIILHGISCQIISTQFYHTFSSLFLNTTEKFVALKKYTNQLFEQKYFSVECNSFKHILELELQKYKKREEASYTMC